MVILGGSSRLWGAVLGAACLTLLQEAFQSQALFGDWSTHWHLTFGLSIIALVALMPNGLIGICGQWRDRRRAYAPLAVSRNKRSEEHTSDLQSLMRISYAAFLLKKKT